MLDSIMSYLTYTYHLKCKFIELKMVKIESTTSKGGPLIVEILLKIVVGYNDNHILVYLVDMLKLQSIIHNAIK